MQIPGFDHKAKVYRTTLAKIIASLPKDIDPERVKIESYCQAYSDGADCWLGVRIEEEEAR